MRKVWSLLLLALSGGCSVTPYDPPAPPTPPIVVPPTPGPVDPPKPAPAPASAVQWATVRTLAAGQSETVVRTAMSIPPVTDTKQDDGSKLVRWAAAHPDGKGRYVVVQFDGGILTGFAVLPMVE